MKALTMEKAAFALLISATLALAILGDMVIYMTVR
jgi:hypothetical protein